MKCAFKIVIINYYYYYYYYKIIIIIIIIIDNRFRLYRNRSQFSLSLCLSLGCQVVLLLMQLGLGDDPGGNEVLFEM